MESVPYALEATQDLIKYYSSAEGNHTETLQTLETALDTYVEELGGPENATIALQNITEKDLSFEKIDEEGFVNFEEFCQLCRGEKLQKVGCARLLTAPIY